MNDDKLSKPEKPLVTGDERALRKDLRMRRRALREGWNIPAEMKADMVSETWAAVKAKNLDPKTNIMAVKLGVEIDKLIFSVLESEIRDDKLDHEEATEKTDHKIQVVYVNKIVPTNDDDG